MPVAVPTQGTPRAPEAGHVPAEAVRRWVTTALLALLVAGGSVLLGLWQWHRHVERSAAVQVVLTNQAAAPVPLGEVLAADAAPTADQAWQQVVVRGEYLPDVAVLLRNRPVDSQPGFHVLEALRIAEGPLAGSVLVVDRGWVPIGDDGSAPGAVPAPPSGVATVVGQLRSPEPLSPREAPAGQVQAIAPDQVRDAAGTGWDAGATLDAYAMVVTEDGDEPAGLGSLARPATDLGSHLSYAFQWWVFALGAIVGAVVLVARDVRELRHGGDEHDDQDGGAPTSPGAAQASGPQRRQRRTAEQDEDDALDAQEAAREARAGADRRPTP